MHKRTVFLVNPKFQIKFSLYICVILFLSSLIYPITIYELIDKFIIYLQANNSENVQAILDKRQSLIAILALWQLGFIGLVFITSIFMTHKIAGPIYKAKKFFKLVREKKTNGELYFRKGDYFHELADEVNKTFRSIDHSRSEEMVYISEVQTYLNNLKINLPEDKVLVVNEISSKLEGMQTKFIDN